MHADSLPFLLRNLLEQGRLSADDLSSFDNVDQLSDVELEDRLLKSGKVDEVGLAASVAQTLGRSWFELEELMGSESVSEMKPDGSRADWGELQAVLGGLGNGAQLDAAWCATAGVQPLGERDGTLHVVAANAACTDLSDELRKRLSQAVILHPATRSLRARIEVSRAAGLATPHDAGPLADLASMASGDDAVVAAPLGNEQALGAEPLLGAEAPLGTEPAQGADAPLGAEPAAADPGMAAGLSGGLGDLGADLGSGLAGENNADYGGGGESGLKDYDDTVDVDLGRPLPPGPESQVLRLVNHVLSEGVKRGASDIHMEPYEGDVRIRMRVDGKLLEFDKPPRQFFPQMISRLKILSKMDIAEKRVPQDGGIAMRDGKSRVDLRASTVPTVYGEKMVLRILDKDGIPDNMEFLGFSDRQAKDFIEAAESHHGLMFVTGPTGSGKSTTLYCALNLTNKPDKNIVTVEDPVEFKFYGLNQVPIRASAGMTFAGALRAFLRQDPDVIMVGEVRDGETAQICMRAALTGHLVVSTLHTNSALQVVTRLTDMGIEPFLLGPALRMLQAQRLVRRLCTECKIQYEMPTDVARRHAMEAGEVLFGPAEEPDCPKCHGSGYKGRVGIYEVVPVDEALQELIIKATPEKIMEQTVRERGIDLIPDSARIKLREGITSLQEVSDYIKDIAVE